MGKRNNLLFGIILLGIIALIFIMSVSCTHERSTIEIQNAQNDILRIDTVIKRYDSIITKTKIKTNEKIVVIYLLPDSILIDSLRSKLKEFDSTGTPKNVINNGTE